ncbi:MAG: GMC family oxidoreductase [Polyangiales bacterium]
MNYDYIVVGGGSAGCVVAAELVRRNAGTVLLIEAGPSAEDHTETLVASRYKEAFINDAVMGERFTTKQAHAGNQQLFAGTGTVLGGSGSVNGMVYTRGSVEDYNEWPSGWKWNDVTPDFVEIEKVLRPHQRPPTKWNDACIASATANGFSQSNDLNNGKMHNAIGYEWMSYENDERRSSYVSFIRDRGANNALTIMTNTCVERVLFDDRQRAIGVQIDRGGEHSIIRANAEVVLCAGALETPKLLMLSGVGPADHLRDFDIKLVLDQPTIGANLHDHPNVPVFFKSNHEIDCFYPQLYSFYRTNTETDLPPTQSDTCYVLAGSLGVELHDEAHASIKSDPASLLRPKLPRIRAPLRRRCVQKHVDPTLRRSALRNHRDSRKAKSRGTLRLQSTDAREQALIDPNYYAEKEDMDTMILGVKKARTIAAANGLSEYAPKELMPGARKTSDTAIQKYIQKNSITTYHFAGT